MESSRSPLPPAAASAGLSAAFCSPALRPSWGLQPMITGRGKCHEAVKLCRPLPTTPVPVRSLLSGCSLKTITRLLPQGLCTCPALCLGFPSPHTDTRLTLAYLSFLHTGVLLIYRHCVCMSLICVRLFCDPMDCSPSSSSVHGIFQARILE